MRLDPPPALTAARRAFVVVGALLLAADGVLVLLYVGYKFGLGGDALSLGQDGGHAEVLQYAKTLWIGLCAAWLAVQSRQPVYAALAALFLGLLVDDAGQLHEFWGTRLADALALPAVAGLRAVDLGEVLFLGAWVGAVFVFGVVAYRRSDRPARKTARWALGALVALAAFGVGADLLHQGVTGLVEINGLHTLLTLVEEGGELVVMSVIAAGAVACVLGHRPAPAGGPPPAGPGRDRPAQATGRGGEVYAGA